MVELNESISHSGNNGLLVVISGPSGAGKDTILNYLKAQDNPYFFAVTATTRPKRPDERQGIDYLFMEQEDFDHLIRTDKLLEWAMVYGYYYGVPSAPVLQALNDGKDVILKTDVQGATTIKKLAPKGILIFLTPPSLETLELRLRGRMTESQEDLDLRLRTAHQEFEKIPMFDYLITSRDDQVAQTSSLIKAIISAERCQANPPWIEL